MLNELLVKIKAKESTQNKLNDLILQKQDLEGKLKDQRKVLRKENDDVEKLEYGNLSSFFYELMGTKEQKLSKEREEAYQAKLKYDSLEYQLQDVQKGISYFEQALEEIEKCENQYQELYASKLDELKTRNPNVSAIENDLLTSANYKKELEEAIGAGEIALKTTDKILRKLDKAKGWSQYDLIGRGGFGDFIKYSHLEDVQNLINELQAQLSRFKTELLDVKIDLSTSVSIDSFLKFADFWFDDIFSAFAVYERIKKAIVQITSTYESIESVLNSLKESYINEQKKEAQLKEKLDKVILES